MSAYRRLLAGLVEEERAALPPFGAQASWCSTQGAERAWGEVGTLHQFVTSRGMGLLLYMLKHINDSMAAMYLVHDMLERSVFEERRSSSSNDTLLRLTSLQ